MKTILYSKSFLRVNLIYFCALLVTHFVNAQEMDVRIFTTKDGLPSTYVFSTYQDKLGYIWIGSPDGLSRFDGKYFTNYTMLDGLPDTRTGGGFMDSRFRYWAVTSRGMAEFKGNRFISYPLSDSQKIRWVFQILETKQGRVWALTSSGVYEFNLNKWEKIKLYHGYENHACRNIVETNEGLYINYGNLLVMKQPNDSFKILGTLKHDGYYYNHMSSSAGEIFISTLDGMYQIINQELVRLPGELGSLKGLYGYFRDSKKRFWVGSDKMGIQVRIAGDTTHFISVYKRPADILIQHISEDNQGNIWISCGIGLMRIAEKGFRVFEMATLGGKGKLFNVLQPPTGPLLINNGSLVFQTFENGAFSTQKLQSIGTPLPNNELIIDNYAFDNKNRYWYYLRGFALAVQSGNKVYMQTGKLSQLGDEVFDVLFDNYRKKIIVAIRTQKFPCQFDDTSFNSLTISNNNIEVKGNISRLHQCANGTILFATDEGLIYSIDKQNTCKLQLNEFHTQGLISGFHNDPSGDVWIVYNGRGLHRYSWQGNSLILKEQLTKSNGLSNNNLKTLCFDNNNNLWVSTNSDITVFSNKTNTSKGYNYQIVNFFEAEDLHADGIYGTRMTKDKKGNIWFFSGQSLVCFYPEKINYNPPIPFIQIEKLELNLRQTNWSEHADSLSGIFQLPYHLKLSHDNNTLGIYYKGISSSGTNGIRYSYLLEGLENLWSSPSSNDFVSFVNLPPGKYVFKVKAQLPSTRWSEPAVFSFEIKKAFWQTWWFYTSLVVVILTGIYLLFRYRLRQKINMLEMRNRISQDLHDEIGSSMSGINLLSQMASDKLSTNKPDEASEYLFKVKNYSQDVIEKLGDMVWIFNPQNDSIEKLLQRLKSFTLSIALSKNIKIHFAADRETEEINLTIRQRKEMYLISKEALNNAFKYADCNNIYYSLSSRGSKLVLRIQDDGKGFIKSGNMNGNGLKNMQARAGEVGANFHYESQPGKGTIISVEF